MEQRDGGRLVVTGVAFEQAQLARLDELAARQRRSRSFVVRDAVEDLLIREERREAQTREAR